jgi:hypothetical protein
VSRREGFVCDQCQAFAPSLPAPVSWIALSGGDFVGATLCSLACLRAWTLARIELRHEGLTNTERLLVERMEKSPGQPVGQVALAAAIGYHTFAGDTALKQLFRAHIHNLRRKGVQVECFRGQGYGVRG